MRRGAAATLGVVLLLALPAGALSGQDPADVRLGITYQPGYLPALAMPPVKAGPGLESLAARIDTILRRDLDFSDRFEILEVSDSLGVGSSVNYALWNELGAVWVVSADVSGTTAAPLLRVALHDIVYGQLRNVQAWALPAPDADGFRMAVHRASDAIVEWATGEPGIAATRVVFRRGVGEGRSDVFVVDSDGEGVRRLTTEEGHVYSPSLSPDGTRLLYQVLGSDGETAIYEKDLRSGRKRAISSGSAQHLTPAYAPDGRIALARWTGDGTEIFIAGGGRVTSTPGGQALNPSFSPDGRYIAFEADALGQQQIYVQEVGGGRPRLISQYFRGERGSAASPDWSPRGDRIVYMAWLRNAFQIMAANPDGADRRALTAQGRNEDPSWAPDGRHVVFASASRRGRSLLILDSVTGRTRVLTSGQADAVPDWSSPVPAP